MKKTLKYILTAFLLLTGWAGSAAWAEEYVISSASDLVAFAATVSSGTTSANAKLTADVNMSGQTWTGLKGFSGTFDGGGFTISGLSAPLCLTTGGATIKNLTLSGSLASTQARFSAFVCDHTSGNLTIENCTNTTTISASHDRVGGFVGNVSAGTATLTGCTNTADITSTKGNVAGILGDTSSSSTVLTNCHNTGDIECTGSLAQVAGIVATCRAEAYAVITIKKCSNEGNITGKANSSGNSNTAGILGWLSNKESKTLTIEECSNSGAITATGNNVGSLLGQAGAGTIVNVFNSCNTGNVTGGSESDVRTLCGKVFSPENCTMKNCWNAGTLTGGTTKTLVISTSSITNSYNIASNALSSAQGAATLIEGFDSSWITNGHFTYYVNTVAGSTVYYQNIDNGTADSYPTLDSTHGTVYANGSFLCDGVTEVDVTYSNTNTGMTVPDHTFVDGVCTVCHIYNPSDIVDGVYQIGTAAQLRWFSDFVNSKTANSNYANAVLTADIDLQGEPFTPIGRYGDTSSTKVNYCGTFDGQGHVIKNLKVDEGDGVEAGLFGRVRYGAIKNLGVVNADVKTDNIDGRAGIIAGFNFSETFTNCFSTGTLTISGTSIGNNNWGGIVGGTYGYDECTYINCWTTYDGLLDGNTPATATRTNCYATNDSRVNSITSEQVGSGYLCYALNGGSQNPTWYQNLDNGEPVDAYPVLNSEHGTVYLVVSGGTTAYSNSKGDVTFVDNVSFASDVPVAIGGAFRFAATGLQSGDKLVLTSVSGGAEYSLDVTSGSIDGYVTIPAAFVSDEYVLTLVRGSEHQNLGTSTLTVYEKVPVGPSEVIAHRGYWDVSGAAQNSHASLQNALNLGIYGSELDVWLTTDGRLMVNHDPSRNGVTIAESTYDQCKVLTLENGETMPTLDEMLDIMAATTSPTKLIIEIKEHSTDALNNAAADAVLALVKAYGLESRVEYISFSSVACKRIISKEPTALVSYLDGVNEEFSPSTLKAQGYAGIDYRQNKMLNHREWYADAHANGMTVNVWTVDNDVIMSYLMNFGADYITTNNPIAAMTTKAQEQTLEEMEAAGQAIEDCEKYRISTDISGTTYYVKADGTLTSDVSDADIYTLIKTPGKANNSTPSAYDYGYHILNGKSYFTNTPISGGKAVLEPGKFETTEEYSRVEYESQVLFLKDGKYAIRTSNTSIANFTSSGWSDCGRVFWTVKSGHTAGYSYEPAYIWKIDKVGTALAGNISGQITSNGIGVSDVMVSDGVEVTVTDAEGYYTLTSEKKNGYVFYSLPRGFEPMLADGFQPRFWEPFTSDDPTVSETHNFELIPSDNDNYTLILGADSHLAGGRLEDLSQYEQGYIARIKEENATAEELSRPIYSMILGDLSWDYYWYDRDYDLQSFMNTCKNVGYPMALWPVIGNHDNDGAVPSSSMTDFLSAAPWRSYVCPNYYSMNLGRVHYIILDDIVYLNEDKGGYTPPGVVGSRNYKNQITDEQMEWLAKDLALIEDKTTPIVVALHIPTWTLNGNTFAAKDNLVEDGGAVLAEALKDFQNVHIVSGHTHYNYTAHPADYPNITEHNIAAICATWWWTGNLVDRHICRDGSPGGYSKWEVNGDDITWEYQAIDTRDNPQVRIYDMNSVRDLYKSDSDMKGLLSTYTSRQDYSSIPDNQVLVNVFAYDEGWTVEVFEGDTKLDATRVFGEDPLHTICYDLIRYKAVGKLDNTEFATSKTTHLFSAQASTATEPISVRVTDNFGRVYKASITRPLAYTTTMDHIVDPNGNINLVFIGNSITYGATLSERSTQAPPVVTGKLVEAATGVTTHVYNGGVSGYSTQDFLDDKQSCYTNVVSNATRLSRNGGRLYFSIQLGTNDSKKNSSKERYSKATYKANLEALIGKLTAEFPSCKIIINYPPWYSDNTYTGASEFTADGQALLHSYYDVIDEVTGEYDNVFAGDRNTWDVFAEKTELFTPETSANAVGAYYLHPNAEGARRLALIWTKGILPAIESDGISGTTTQTAREGLTEGNYGTICLPYEVMDVTGAKFYKVASQVLEEDTLNHITLKEAGELMAGEAYIYQATADKMDVTYVTGYEVSSPVPAAKSGTGVTGVFERTAMPVGVFMLKDNHLYYVDVENYAFAGAGKGWVDLTDVPEGEDEPAGVKLYVIGEDDATSINEELRVKPEGSTSIYNLAGQVVNRKLPRGVYIQNGRKVIK